MLDPSSPLALAWFGGFFDAEGHAGLNRIICPYTRLDGTRSIRYRPRLHINHTDETTLHVVMEILNAHCLDSMCEISWCRSSSEGRQPYWSLRVTGYKRCLHWMGILFPFLRTKQARARLITEYCTIGIKKQHKGPDFSVYSPREKDILSVLGVPADFSHRPLSRLRTLPCDSLPIETQNHWTPTTSLAWYGGFFDGEGSIMLYMRPTTLGVDTATPIVYVSNTHMPTMGVIREIMDSRNLAYRCQESRLMYYKKEQSPQWAINATGGKRCVPWLEVLLPYLVTKRSKAEEVLSFWENNIFAPNYVSQHDREKVKALYATGSYSQKQIGVMLSISQATVSRIIRGRR